jgi:hypothetical protein
MGFPTDWDISKVQSSTTLDIDQLSPIILGGSLFVDSIDAPERVTLHNTTYTNGLTSGSIRSIIRVTDLTTTAIERVGFVFMQNAPSMSGLVDAGYGVFLNAGNGLSSPFLSISKFTTGLHAPPLDDLLTLMSFDAPLLGEDFVLEAEWISDAGVLEGTQIYVRYALGTNFADLELMMEHLDDTSPLITTATESLAVAFSGIGHFRVLYDETSIFEVV